jgi:hypothetical protein
MNDPHDPESVRAVMARLDEVRSQFYDVLWAADTERLTTRPSAEVWSALERVRHLLFVEDLYLYRWILRHDEPWNGMGLLPAFLAHDPECAETGCEPTDDLDAVLQAWMGIHGRTFAFVASAATEKLRRHTGDVDFGQGTVGQVLQGSARHDLHHIRRAEALIV